MQNSPDLNPATYLSFSYSLLDFGFISYLFGFVSFSDLYFYFGEYNSLSEHDSTQNSTADISTAKRKEGKKNNKVEKSKGGKGMSTQ